MNDQLEHTPPLDECDDDFQSRQIAASVSLDIAMEGE